MNEVGLASTYMLAKYPYHVLRKEGRKVGLSHVISSVTWLKLVTFSES